MRCTRSHSTTSSSGQGRSAGNITNGNDRWRSCRRVIPPAPRTPPPPGCSNASVRRTWSAACSSNGASGSSPSIRRPSRQCAPRAPIASAPWAFEAEPEVPHRVEGHRSLSPNSMLRGSDSQTAAGQTDPQQHSPAICAGVAGRARGKPPTTHARRFEWLVQTPGARRANARSTAPAAAPGGAGRPPSLGARSHRGSGSEAAARAPCGRGSSGSRCGR
jgi:hypothetical protein